MMKIHISDALCVYISKGKKGSTQKVRCFVSGNPFLIIRKNS